MNIVSDSDIDSRVFPIGDKNVTSMGDVSFVGLYANNFFGATIKYFPYPEKAQKWPNPDPEKAKMGVKSFYANFNHLLCQLQHPSLSVYPFGFLQKITLSIHVSP